MRSGSSWRRRPLPGTRNRLRRFAGVLRALPAWPTAHSDAQDDPTPRPFGVAVRSMNDGAQTFLEIANDSPYPLRLASLLDAPASAFVEDLGRGLRLSPVSEGGGRNLVLDLLPYGVAAIRIGAPRVQLSSVTPYPSEAVLASMQARFNELTAQLARLNHGLSAVAAEPANSGFRARSQSGFIAARPAGCPGTARSRLPHRREPDRFPVAGEWKGTRRAAPSTIAIDRENPHSGQGSLRLTAAVGSGLSGQ